MDRVFYYKNNSYMKHIKKIKSTNMQQLKRRIGFHEDCPNHGQVHIPHVDQHIQFAQSSCFHVSKTRHGRGQSFIHEKPSAHTLPLSLLGQPPGLSKKLKCLLEFHYFSSIFLLFQPIWCVFDNR